MHQLPVLLSLLRLEVHLADEVLPRLDDDPRVVVVRRMVNKEAEVKVTRLVGILVVEL